MGGHGGTWGDKGGTWGAWAHGDMGTLGDMGGHGRTWGHGGTWGTYGDMGAWEDMGGHGGTWGTPGGHMADMGDMGTPEDMETRGDMGAWGTWGHLGTPGGHGGHGDTWWTWGHCPLGTLGVPWDGGIIMGSPLRGDTSRDVWDTGGPRHCGVTDGGGEHAGEDGDTEVTPWGHRGDAHRGRG